MLKNLDNTVNKLCGRLAKLEKSSKSATTNCCPLIYQGLSGSIGSMGASKGDFVRVIPNTTGS
ncbi:MAG: hypothetical protein ACTSQG_12045, partial [Promethearchaeota archaeon]